MKIIRLPRRNYSQSSEYFNTLANNSLVRLHVEYASAAWSRFERRHVNALEDVQWSAKRFACSDYSRFSSVTSMQQSIGWDIHEVCLLISISPVMYKIVRDLAHLILRPSTLAYRGTRSNNPERFRHISAHSNAYKFYFSPRTIQSQLLFLKGTPYQIKANIVQWRNIVYCCK